MTSIGLRPALLFFSLAGVSTTASISARKLSNGTTRSIISSGSPFAEIAASRLSASKKLNCPIVPEPANREITNQTRTNPVEVAIFRGAHKQKLLGLAHGGATREALTKDTISSFPLLLPPRDLVFLYGRIAEP